MKNLFLLRHCEAYHFEENKSDHEKQLNENGRKCAKLLKKWFEKNNIVFLLWGNYAKEKAKLIDEKKHLILNSGHPSPLSANRGGWFGNKHFSLCNQYLEEKGIEKIIW